MTTSTAWWDAPLPTVRVRPHLCTADLRGLVDTDVMGGLIALTCIRDVGHLGRHRTVDGVLFTLAGEVRR